MVNSGGHATWQTQQRPACLVDQATQACRPREAAGAEFGRDSPLLELQAKGPGLVAENDIFDAAVGDEVAEGVLALVGGDSPPGSTQGATNVPTPVHIVWILAGVAFAPPTPLLW